MVRQVSGRWVWHWWLIAGILGRSAVGPRHHAWLWGVSPTLPCRHFLSSGSKEADEAVGPAVIFPSCFPLLTNQVRPCCALFDPGTLVFPAISLAYFQDFLESGPCIFFTLSTSVFFLKEITVKEGRCGNMLCSSSAFLS